MIYSRIEKYFKEDKLEELLKECSESFEKIEYYSHSLRNKIIDNLSETDLAMKELTGIYMYLNVVCMIAETEKINRESLYYYERKLELENEGIKKVVGSQIEREASNHVKNYRRVRNIFEAYKNSCDRAISVCQSSLKTWEREKGLKQ